jgi:hypothetical protein
MPLRTFAATGLAAVLAAGLAAVPATAAPTTEKSAQSTQANPGAFSFGVIGDIPYGEAEIAKFPSRIQDINADKDLKFVVHVGDIKNGSSLCTDEYFADIRADFDTFEHPLVYTPGDNEWVDCHRANNGAYNPLERLDKLREVFRFARNRVAFSVLNVQGSNNSLQPWSGLGFTEPTAEQEAEVRNRIEAALEQLRGTFRDAERRHDRAVVIMTQADMFDPSLLAGAVKDPESVSGFREIVNVLAEEANRFDGAVYLVNGDSHVFAEDRPLAGDSAWLDVYGRQAEAGMLQRITVDGSANATNYVRFSVAPNSAADANSLSWEKVGYRQ